jgi:hypothetical protein
MRVRKNRPLPTPRTLAAFAIGLAAGAAQAQEVSPWYFGATQSLTHDSNVYRLPEGPADNYSSTGLIGGFDQPYGRQRFFGTANVRYNKYQDQDTLDNTSYGLNAGWDWATIEKLSGSFGASANQSLATQDGTTARPSTNRNLLKTDQLSAAVRWGGAGRLGIDGNVAHSRAVYSAPESASSNSSGNTASLGVNYSVNPDLRLGTAFRVTRTKQPNGGQFGQNTGGWVKSDGRNIDLLADYQYSPQTGVNARLSYTRQTDSGGTGRDFSGLTGALSGRYSPTAKIGLTASYNRDAGTNGTFFNTVATPGSTTNRALFENSQTTDVFALGANYAATAKISATAGYQYRSAKIVNNTGGASLGDYTDKSRVATLGASWAITRALQLGCNLSRETRDVSSSAGYSYSANVGGCTAQFTLR